MANLNISLTNDELASAITDSFDHSESLSLILALDARIADCGFTVELIKTLLASLKNDMTIKEIRKELAN